MKFFAVMASVALLAAGTTSCSSDNNDGESGSAELLIPESVVDGVRVQSDGTTEFTFDQKTGAPLTAKYQSEPFVFNYAETRAKSTGKHLSSIVLSSSEAGVSYKAYNFAFNSKGYLTSMTEEMNYDRIALTLRFTITYSNDRVTRIKYVADGYEGAEMYYDCKWNGKNLASVNMTDNSGKAETNFYEYDYVNAPNNKYNIWTYDMTGMFAASGHYALLFFADLGYLGLPSQALPTIYSYTNKSAKNYLIGYETDNSGRVTAIYRYDESGAQYNPTYYNYTKL